MFPAIISGIGLYLCYLGMQRWSALPTSREEPWWMLVWGNTVRVCAVLCLVTMLWALGRAIVGC